MRTLQKPFKFQPTQQKSNLYNLSKECDRRERGFQVFISGANKERLKLKDLQSEALQAKKGQTNSNNTSQRKSTGNQANNTIAKRKFWQKNSNINIKGSDGSKFITSNQKSPKLGSGIFGPILYDITSKNIDLNSNAIRKSQLNDIRNRYKAYFHIDGHGFCYSKNLSKPSTPIKYQIDRASPILNKRNIRHLKKIQGRSPLDSSSPLGAHSNNSEEQQSQCDSLLTKNKKCISNLQGYLTPNYEYFESEKENNDQSSEGSTAKVSTLLDSCDGIDYDVFYHKEQNICKSAKALLPDLLDETDSNGGDDNNSDFRDECRNENSTNKFRPCNELWLKGTMSSDKSEENGNEFDDYDERTLVSLNKYEVLDDFIVENNGNQETNSVPPLQKALSPFFKVENTNNRHVIEEKERYFVNENQCILNRNEKSLSKNIASLELPLTNVSNEKENAFKLNLRYVHQKLNSKVYDKANLNMHQSYKSDEPFIDSNVSGSNLTTNHSTIYSSTPSSNQVSPKQVTCKDQQSLMLLSKNSSVKQKDDDIEVDDGKKCISSSFQSRKFKIEKFYKKISSDLRGRLLSARVHKLDIRKQIYLSQILDKLEIVHVSRSLDSFCHFNLLGIGIEDGLYA